MFLNKNLLIIYRNTINQMNCHVRKLEEKIMEYYKNAPPSTCNKG